MDFWRCLTHVYILRDQVTPWTLKLSAFLLILWLFSSVGPSMQNFKPLQLLRRWRWSRLSIIPLLLLSFLLFTWLLLFSLVSGVSADEPTPTYAPLFPTPTPGANVLDCPVGVPGNYLTVTPDVAWQALCSRCLPTRIIPTSTPGPTSLVGSILTGTAAAAGQGGVCPTSGPHNPLAAIPGDGGGCVTATPAAPFATSTPAVVATATPGSYAAVNPLNYGAPGSVSSSVNSYTVRVNISGNAQAVSGQRYTVASVVDNSRVYYSLDWYVVIKSYDGGPSFIPTVRVGTSSGSSYVNLSPVGGACVVTYPEWFPYITCHYVSSGSFLSTGAINIGWMISQGSIWGASHSGNGWIEFSSRDQYSPTPTPVPTLVPTATPDLTNQYCAVVRNEGDAGDTGVVLPVISSGVPSCGGITGFILPFSWFQLVGFDLPDVTMPSVHLCFAPTLFGHLVILDNSIDLDSIAFILGVLFLIAIIF